MGALFVFSFGLFVLAASCYVLVILSNPLERIGGRIGKLLHLPEDVIAATFQALATSGPEIAMAILAATAFIGASAWKSLEMGERACSGCLNMCFSAMDNLLGIGALGIIFMIYKGTVRRDEKIIVTPSVKVSLVFYIVASTCLCLFIRDGQIVLWEAWVLMSIGISFVVSQFFVPKWLQKLADRNENSDETGDSNDDNDEKPMPTTLGSWFGELAGQGFLYAFLVFALIVMVRQCLASTFNMALVGVFSVGGILIALTSYVSSFPEFAMTYRYAISNKKSALLAMLFGSNVIDLAFAGFRPIWTKEAMAVYTTGRFPELLPLYLWALPILALICFVGLLTKKIKYGHAIPAIVFYIVYIISGFVLL